MPKQRSLDNNGLRTRLKHRFEAHSITAAELSRRTGIPRQVISDWLAGAMPRRLDHLKKVVDLLKTTIDELCFGDVAEPLVVTIPNSMEPSSEHDLVGRFEIVVRKIRDEV